MVCVLCVHHTVETHNGLCTQCTPHCGNTKLCVLCVHHPVETQWFVYSVYTTLWKHNGLCTMCTPHCGNTMVCVLCVHHTVETQCFMYSVYTTLWKHNGLCTLCTPHCGNTHWFVYSVYTTLWKHTICCTLCTPHCGNTMVCVLCVHHTVETQWFVYSVYTTLWKHNGLCTLCTPHYGNTMVCVLCVHHTVETQWFVYSVYTTPVETHNGLYSLCTPHCGNTQWFVYSVYTTLWKHNGLRTLCTPHCGSTMVCVTLVIHLFCGIIIPAGWAPSTLCTLSHCCANKSHGLLYSVYIGHKNVWNTMGYWKMVASGGIQHPHCGNFNWFPCRSVYTTEFFWNHNGLCTAVYTKLWKHQMVPQGTLCTLLTVETQWFVYSLQLHHTVETQCCSRMLLMTVHHPVEQGLSNGLYDSRLYTTTVWNTMVCVTLSTPHCGPITQWFAYSVYTTLWSNNGLCTLCTASTGAWNTMGFWWGDSVSGQSSTVDHQHIWFVYSVYTTLWRCCTMVCVLWQYTKLWKHNGLRTLCHSHTVEMLQCQVSLFVTVHAFCTLTFTVEAQWFVF